MVKHGGHFLTAPLQNTSLIYLTIPFQHDTLQTQPTTTEPDMTEDSITRFMGIFVLVLFSLLAIEGCTSEPENKPPYQENVNCAEKKAGSRPACWTSNDWQAYCSNTGSCRR